MEGETYSQREVYDHPNTEQMGRGEGHYVSR